MLFQKAKQAWLRFIQSRRIHNDFCPYCRLPVETVQYFEGTFWVPAKICPNYHFGILFYTGTPMLDMLHINYQMMDNGGDRIPFPRENIRTREDILEELGGE